MGPIPIVGSIELFTYLKYFLASLYTYIMLDKSSSLTLKNAAILGFITLIILFFLLFLLNSSNVNFTQRIGMAVLGIFTVWVGGVVIKKRVLNGSITRPLPILKGISAVIAGYFILALGLELIVNSIFMFETVSINFLSNICNMSSRLNCE